jgi:hypothetical protein
MFFEMICTCSASVHIETDIDENTEASWLLVNRFINAHVKCGYMTPIEEQNPKSTTQLNIKLSPEADA